MYIFKQMFKKIYIQRFQHKKSLNYKTEMRILIFKYWYNLYLT